MGRNTEAMCRLCRAESEKLFLKGKRCLTDKCAIERKGYPPGEKKKRRRFKDSNYKLQLREKQKLKIPKPKRTTKQESENSNRKNRFSEETITCSANNWLSEKRHS